MIGIVDYGMGNLFSVEKALERLGVSSFISEDPILLQEADALILPGVGAFKDAMSCLHNAHLVGFLQQQKKPLLGICLGMQLLFEESEENGATKGLGLLPGRIVRLRGETGTGQQLKIPHMGWNQLTFQKTSPILAGLNEEYVYFVHSYYAEMKQEHLIASCAYGVNVPAIVGSGHVYGMQFHPEKSGQLGMALLNQFVKIVMNEVKQT